MPELKETNHDCCYYCCFLNREEDILDYYYNCVHEVWPEVVISWTDNDASDVHCYSRLFRGICAEFERCDGGEFEWNSPMGLVSQ